MERDTNHSSDTPAEEPPPTTVPINAPGSKVPALPAEIWGIICSHADIRTLWTGLRLTSHKLRTEAEREMRINRLCKMRINWRLNLEMLIPNCYCKSRFTIKNLSHFSEDDERVHFDVDDGIKADPQSCVHSRLSYGNTGHEFKLAFNPTYHRLIVQQLRYRNHPPFPIDFAPVLWDRSIVLGGVVRQVELPELEVDFVAGQISFEWKLFMTEFLAEAFLARSLERQWRINSVLSERYREEEEQNRLARAKAVAIHEEAQRAKKTAGRALEQKEKPDDDVGNYIEEGAARRRRKKENRVQLLADLDIERRRRIGDAV